MRVPKSWKLFKVGLLLMGLVQDATPLSPAAAAADCLEVTFEFTLVPFISMPVHIILYLLSYQ